MIDPLATALAGALSTLIGLLGWFVRQLARGKLIPESWVHHLIAENQALRAERDAHAATAEQVEQLAAAVQESNRMAAAVQAAVIEGRRDP